MESSSIKINSISIDLAAAAKLDTRKCEHFSIRGFVAEARERDHRKCWPFSEDIVELGDNQIYALPSLSVPKYRWWRCSSCIKDINNDNDSLLQSHSRLIKEKKLDTDHSSATMSSKIRLTSTIVTDKKEKKNDETAMFLKKFRRRAKDSSTVKRKSSKLANPEQVSKRCREKANVSESREVVTAFRSFEIAGVVDDLPNKAITENHNKKSSDLVEQDEGDNVSSESMNGSHPQKSRLLSELLGSRNIETLSKMEPIRGRKRKYTGDEECITPEATNYANRILSTTRKASKSCDSEDNNNNNNNMVSSTESRPSLESKSNDGGFDKDHIKENQRNRKFQGAEESLQKDTYDYDYASPVKGDDRAILKDIGKNHFRNFGSSFKSTNAVGCLRSGVNVDLSSNRNTTGSSSLNDKRRYTSSNQAVDTSFAPQKDISLVHGKGKGMEVVVEEFSGASRIQSKKPEHTDDIPMDKIELMVKNQYERYLPDREEDKQPSQATTSISKNALLIDLNETYDNSMENTLRQPKPHGKNVATKEGHYMTGMHNPLEFLPGSQFGQQPYNLPPGFGMSMAPLTQENQSSSSILFPGVVGPNRQSGHNCQCLGNVPSTMANHHNPSPSPSPSPFWVLRVCNTCQQPQYREPSHPIWPDSMTSSHAPKQSPLSMPQMFMEPNTQNLSFVDNMKQIRGFEGFTSKPHDSIYSNVSSIPAMQLLSLMDPQLRSNIPIDPTQNTTFVKRPFSPVHQSNVLVGPQAGDCSKSAYPTKQWPFEFYSKRVTAPETSRIIPPVGISSFSFQNEKSSTQNPDFTLQSSWNHRQEKKPNNFEPIYNNSHHQKPFFTSSSKSNDPGKFWLLGASDSMMLPLKFHMTDNTKKHKTKKPQSYNAVSDGPSRSTCGPTVCILNRNPADFTIPDAPGNIYMIKGEDLKLKKQAGFRRKPSLCKQDALTQNKNPIPPAAENA